MASNDKSPGENGERERIGRYELLTECAPGAIGGLWAARIVSGANEGKIVSLRRIAPRAGIDARLVQEACEAAWAAMELRIKGVLPVIDVVVADGRVGVIRDYVEGDTLHTVLREAAKKNEKVPAPVAQRIALEAVTALAAMDAAGREQPEMAEFLFGGMWSDRVLVHSDGQVSLCDLELMGKGAAAASRSRDNDMLAFRAPEHLQMGGQFDARTDVFLMGVVLWELFAGRRLFSGQCDPALSEAIHGSPIPRLDSPELKLSVPQAVADVVAKALQRAPADRFPSATPMLEALQKSGAAAATPAEVAAFAGKVMSELWEKCRASIGLASAGKAAASATATPAPKVKTAPAAQLTPRPARAIPRPSSGALPSGKTADKPAALSPTPAPAAVAQAAPAKAEAAEKPAADAPSAAAPQAAPDAPAAGKPVGRLDIKARLGAKKAPEAQSETTAEAGAEPAAEPAADAPAAESAESPTDASAVPAPEADAAATAEEPVRAPALSSMPLEDGDLMDADAPAPSGGPSPRADTASTVEGFALEAADGARAKKTKIIIGAAAVGLVLLAVIIGFAVSGPEQKAEGDAPAVAPSAVKAAATAAPEPTATATEEPAPSATVAPPVETAAAASAEPTATAPSAEATATAPAETAEPKPKPKPVLGPVGPGPAKKPKFVPKGI